MEKLDIKIQYDGIYPCLCMGHLIIWINGKEWDFGKDVLSSGGDIYYDEGLEDYEITTGEWRIYDDCWPVEFPENYKEPVLSAINEEIPYGCCGGCI